jgi:hypothetical protein
MPPSSSSEMESMSLVSREITRPEVYRSWKPTDSRWKWWYTRPRRSNRTAWPIRPDSVMKPRLPK